MKYYTIGEKPQQLEATFISELRLNHADSFSMCLILFNFNPTASTPLTLAANRDEYLNRPTAAAHYWQDNQNILAGRDLISQGTWLGITRQGRFAAVTNVREPHIALEQPRSRGLLTAGYLQGSQSPQAYLTALQTHQQAYAGFNLLLGDFGNGSASLHYMSNRLPGIHELAAGTYGLSNHLLDTPWPKVINGKAQLRQYDQPLNDSPRLLHQHLLHMLSNRSTAPDNRLPHTGVAPSREKALSATFIDLFDPERGHYGTRASTLITIQAQAIHFSEQTYTLSPHPSDQQLSDQQLQADGPAAFFTMTREDPTPESNPTCAGTIHKDTFETHD